jgi:hypothetical protein
MSREELIQYVSKYAERTELKVLLNMFDEIRKGCILNDLMNEVLGEAESHLEKLKIDAQSLTVGQAYLKILEGRIMMLILSQHITKNLKDEKKMFSNSQRITELFVEYQMEGGTRSFQSPANYINKHTMKIERGIIIADEQGIVVRSPGHIYHLNNETFFIQSLNDNDKVLGVLVNNKFSVCREFITTTGHFVFGYIQKEFPKELSIITIDDFDLNSFDPFNAHYTLGKEVIAEIN